MALDPNTPPYTVPDWDAYIDSFSMPVTPDFGAPPVDLAPPPQQLTAPQPVAQEEVPQAGYRLSPQEEAPIEIDQPSQAPLMPEVQQPPPPPIPEARHVTPQVPYLGQIDRDRILGFTDAQGQTTAAPIETPDEYMTGDELGATMAKRSPEEQATFLSDLEQSRNNFAAARMREASETALRTIEQNAEARRQAIEAANQRATDLDAEARQLADMTPMDKLTGGQLLAGVLAGIVGGFAGINNGTNRNQAVDTIDSIAKDAADRHAAKMQVNARQRGAIGQDIAAADDTFRVAQAVQLAVYDSALNKLKADVQLFDPRGTRAAAIMKDAAAIEAARAQVAAKNHADDLKAKQQKFENDIKERETKVKEGQLVLAKAKQAGGGGAKPVKPNDVVMPAEHFEREYGKRPPRDMSQNDFEQWAKTGKIVEDYSKAQRENDPEERTRASVIAAPPAVVVDDAGNVSVKRDTGNLKQADGTTDWIPNTPEEAKAFRKQKTAADGLIEILDEIRVIRDRVGGESSWNNSDYYQRIKVLKNRATKLAKAGTEGMSSDEDMKKIDAALGASDPASFRAQAAGLEEGRKGVERELDIAARNLGYTGKPITYADPLKQKGPAKSAEQSEVERVLTFDPDDAKRQDLYAKELGIDGDAFAKGKADDRGGLIRNALAPTGGMLPSIKAAIDKFREVAANESATPKARQLAREALDRFATESESQAVREYATANAIAGPAPSPEVIQ